MLTTILLYCFIAAAAAIVVYLAAKALYDVARRVVGAYAEFRGTRVVVCPETRKYVAVEVDARHAAATAASGETELRLTKCTRWPEREGCDQDCVHQIANAPMDCAVRTMLTEFYEGKSCALCGHAVGEIHWDEHKPALMRVGDRRTFEWRDVPPETLPEVLGTHLPVCWNCHVAESFRLSHPELVVDRNSKVAAHV